MAAKFRQLPLVICDDRYQHLPDVENQARLAMHSGRQISEEEQCEQYTANGV
ncbi:hypothetical protein PJL15_04293 [Paenarthrobacter nitroguajacolicus]|nr:hypothetical protein [Paenarthrobacter nitroguajacolicus]